MLLRGNYGPGEPIDRNATSLAIGHRSFAATSDYCAFQGTRTFRARFRDPLVAQGMVLEPIEESTRDVGNNRVVALRPPRIQ